MLQSKEWQAKKPMQLACGHTVQAGTMAYTMMHVDGHVETVCLSHALQAFFAEEEREAEAALQSILDKLWRASLGKPKQRRTTG